MISLDELKKTNFSVSERQGSKLIRIDCVSLSQRVEKEIKNVPINRGSLGVIFCENTIDWIISFLAAVNQKATIILLPKDYDVLAYKKILKNFSPNWVWSSNKENKNYLEHNLNHYKFLKKDIKKISKLPQVLLTTSGSTGNAKFVRLSYNALRSNANSIVKYLNLNNNDNALVNLPVSYSYGLSIVNSHLMAGAAIHLEDISPLNKNFFEVCKNLNITNLNGVPETQVMLLKLGFKTKVWPSLRFVTQAGGNLQKRYKQEMKSLSKLSNFQFFVMYGQTEAAPRISFINLTESNEKQINSIGKAVPGGSLEILDNTNELVYKGPNVMLGYANTSDDLDLPDQHKGYLKTGDIAFKDEDGYYYLTGRLKRIGKLSGKRVNLDDIEKVICEALKGDVFCIDIETGILVAGIRISTKKLKSAFCALYPNLTLTQVKFRELDQFFYLSNGKPDYQRFKEFITNGN